MTLLEAKQKIARLERNEEIIGFLTKHEEIQLKNARKVRDSFENVVAGEEIMKERG